MKRNNRKQGFTLIEIMIVVLIIGILLAIAVPNFIRARASSRLKSIVANLKQIDSAATQYAMEQNLASGAAITQANLDGTSGTSFLTWPTGPVSGTYSPGAVSSYATFSGGSAPGSGSNAAGWEANCSADPSVCGL